MPIFDLKKLLFFNPNTNCPLSPVFGVPNIPFKRSRGTGRTSCIAVKYTCCANGAFKSFAVDSKIANVGLSSFYTNRYRLITFLLSDLIRHFRFGPNDEYNDQCQGTINSNTCQALILNIRHAVKRGKMYLEE
jgi:hypothetical protein